MHIRHPQRRIALLAWLACGADALLTPRAVVRRPSALHSNDDAISDFIFDETEKPELGGFSTRDLFECAMMGFDGHEYKTDLTGLTEGDNPRLKEKFYACKGEIRAKLDKVINATESLRSDASVARGYYGTSHLSRAQENAVRQFIQEVVA